MYSTSEIADKLGVAASTIRAWSIQFSVPKKKRQGNSFYTEEALQTLRTIKQLKEESSGMTTIKRVITQTQLDENSDNLARHDCEDMDKTDYAKLYADERYKVGQLEEKIKTLETQLKLLPAPSEWYEEQTKIAQLETENNLLRSSWWYRLFGKK